MLALEMRQAERVAVILEALAADGTVEVTALVGRLGVSAATVRRDLAAPRGAADARRGPTAARWRTMCSTSSPSGTRPRGTRRRRNGSPRRPRPRVADGAVVGLTGGTTTTEVARAISDRRGITVVTNALNIAGELAIRGRPEARRHGRHRAARVLRAGRAGRRAGARAAEPGRRVRRRRRHLARGGAHDAPRDRGAHQPDDDRARAPRRRRGRPLEARPRRLRPDLPARCGRRADHRRGRPGARPSASSPRRGSRDGRVSVGWPQPPADRLGDQVPVGLDQVVHHLDDPHRP